MGCRGPSWPSRPAALVAAQNGPSLKDILRKNLEASGGKAKLAQVKTLSFRTGGTQNVVSSAGELKVLSGKAPSSPRPSWSPAARSSGTRSAFMSEVTGPQATVYQTMAKLYAGLFSLVKFEGQLRARWGRVLRSGEALPSDS